MDAGDIWATVPFDVPADAGKSDIYRNEASDAAMSAVKLAVERFDSGATSRSPSSTLEERRGPTAVLQPGPAPDRLGRRLHGTILRKLRAADSQPGVLDALLGAEWFLHGGHREYELRGPSGRDRGHPRGRRLPCDTGRGRVDPAAETPPDPGRAGDLQAARGRTRSAVCFRRYRRSPHRWQAPAGRPVWTRHPLRAGRRRRLPLVHLPGRRDEHVGPCRRLLRGLPLRPVPPHLGARPGQPRATSSPTASTSASSRRPPTPPRNPGPTSWPWTTWWRPCC